MATRAYHDDDGRLRLLVGLPGGGIPTSFTILGPGKTDTTKGIVLFDELAAQSVMTRYQEKGQEQLPIDYDHGMLSMVTTPDSSKAAAWFTPQVIEGALVATDVEWTPKARQALTDREYRFFSPALHLDDDNRVTRLVNVALTNLPATKGQRPLIAKAVPFKPYPVQESGAWDASAAEGRIRTWAKSGDGVDSAKYAKAFAWYDSEKPDALGSYKLPHHDVVDGSLVTHRRGVIAAGNAVSGSRGGVDIPSQDLASVQSHLAGHYDQLDMTPPWKRQNQSELTHSEDKFMEEILKLLGVKSEPEAVKNLGILLSEAGVEDITELLSQVKAWKVSTSQALELAERVRVLEQERTEHERTDLIAKLNEQGKLPHSLFDWARTQSIESLRLFGESAPVSPKLQTHVEGNGGSTHLSDAELQVCKLLGMTRKEYIEARAQKAEVDEQERARREGKVL